MNPEQELAAEVVDGYGSLLALAILSFIVGAASGLVGVAFRLALDQADRWRAVLITWATASSWQVF